MSKSKYYANLKRSMFSAHRQVGAMPFLLFQYYRTWETASNGIKPKLKTICEDLGVEPSNVCNLRKKLIQAGWIKYENGEVFILKKFILNESRSSDVNENSSDVNPGGNSFILNESEAESEDDKFILNERDSFKMNLNSSDVNENSFKMNRPLKDNRIKRELKEKQHTATTAREAQDYFSKKLITADTGKKVVVVCADSEIFQENGNQPKPSEPEKPPEKSGKSAFSLEEILKYLDICARKYPDGKPRNPIAVAKSLYASGESDALIRATLCPEKAAEDYLQPVEFTDLPCTVCFGSKFETVKGLGARPCLHCWNEREKPTGKEPKGDP